MGEFFVNQDIYFLSFGFFYSLSCIHFAWNFYNMKVVHSSGHVEIPEGGLGVFLEG